jgi:hypothetical protein
MRGHLENIAEAGNQAAAEVAWVETNRGSLNGKPTTGKGVMVRAAVFLTEE